MMPSVDRISELPDDILNSIVSLLSLREATVARALSSSWRHLDVDVVTIEFPYPSFSYNAEVEVSVDKKKFLEYTNAVLDSYKGKGKGKGKGKFILKFKLDLSCYKKRYVDLTDLFNPALMSSSSIENAEVVDIRVIHSTSRNYQKFSNPVKMFVEGKEYCLKLKQVSLSGVELECRDIVLLLSKLVALERLSIECLGVSGVRSYICCPETSRLQHLKISHTLMERSDDEVVICGMKNLVSLSYNGIRTDFQLHDRLPKLVDVSIRCGARSVRGILAGIRNSVAAQLLRLHLHIALHHKPSGGYWSWIFIHLTKLKHLELTVEIHSDDDDIQNIRRIRSYIEAFPCIHELTVKLVWCLAKTSLWQFWHDEYSESDEDSRMSSEMIGRLQVVRMSGCVGSVLEMELALYVIKNARKLKELVVEPRDRIQSREMDRLFQHLLSLTPTHVHLILL